MITDTTVLLDLMRAHGLRLCYRQLDGQWVLIGNGGGQPPSCDSIVFSETAHCAIAQRLVIDLFAGRRGKYENDIYHLTETVPRETLAYIEHRFRS